MSFETWNRFVYETLKANGKLTEGDTVDGVKAKELINILQDIKENIHDINIDSGLLLTTLQGINNSLATLAKCAEEHRAEVYGDLFGEAGTGSGTQREALEGINKSLQRVVTHLDDADRRREEREVFNL